MPTLKQKSQAVASSLRPLLSAIKSWWQQRKRLSPWIAPRPPQQGQVWAQLVGRASLWLVVVRGKAPAFCPGSWMVFEYAGEV